MRETWGTGAPKNSLGMCCFQGIAQFLYNTFQPMIEQKTNGRVRISHCIWKRIQKFRHLHSRLRRRLSAAERFHSWQEKACTWANQHSLSVSTVARSIVRGVTQQVPAPGPQTRNRWKHLILMISQMKHSWHVRKLWWSRVASLRFTTYKDLPTVKKRETAGASRDLRCILCEWRDWLITVSPKWAKPPIEETLNG